MPMRAFETKKNDKFYKFCKTACEKNKKRTVEFEQPDTQELEKEREFIKIRFKTAKKNQLTAHQL